MTTKQHAFTAIRHGAGMIALAAALSLAACGSEVVPPSTEVPAAAGEAVTITNARLVLAPVAGNPAAVYFDLSYAGEGDLTLTEAMVEGAGMSMIHQTSKSEGKMMMMEAQPIALTTDAPVNFAPGGFHVMAMQPSAAWTPGETVKVTLMLSDGTTHSFDAAVRAAGEER